MFKNVLSHIGFLFVVASACTAATAKGPETPREALDAYITKIKSIDTAAGAVDMWDFKAFLAGSFGDAFTKLGAADQEAAIASIRKMITAAYASPKVIEVMAKIEIIGVAEFKLSDDSSAVCFGVKGPDGKTTSMQMKFQKIDGQWRVVDMGAGEGMISSQLRILYAPHLSKVSLAQFARDMSSESEKLFPAGK